MTNISFKAFFTRVALFATLSRLPPLKTFIMDLVYPESVRKNHPFDKLSYEDMGLPTKNIPLVTRGSVSFAIKPEETTLKIIEPANVTPSEFLSATDANRVNTLQAGAKQVLFDNKIDKLRRIVRKTTEALAAQSITGKIEYDIRTADGTIEKYVVNFGTPKTVSITKKWDAADATFGDIIASTGEIVQDLQKTSDGTDIIHLIKRDVYKALANKATKNENLIKVERDRITVGADVFYVCNSQYYDYKAKAYKDAIPDKTVITLARDDAFSLFYCALDSFDADFAGLPFFVEELWIKDPNGVKLIGQSRPMPTPNVSAIRTAQVLA
jgi:hypothetical protein